MKKPSMFLISAILIVFLVTSVSTEKDKEKIDSAVISKLENQEEVAVIIKPSEEQNLISKFLQEKTIENILDDKIVKKEEGLIIANLSEKQMKKLEEISSVERIEYSPQLKAFLDKSASLINATITWPLQVSTINLTGSGETACVIDTGINFSHSDLLGKNKTCVIDCYNKNCIENCSLSDDNGHGTHVAGIIAASENIRGVAQNASLIGLKVLDSDGNSHPSSGVVDLANAIDWCVQNKNNYNISVISMSLGTSELYESYCDSSFSLTITKSINNATAFNISVISAAGNSGNTSAIASPACIQNSTSVGDVYDSDVGSKTWTGTCTDSSTFADKIVCHSNRNSITDLFAPGAMINSTYNNGRYSNEGGTSMATPHVSGAFIIINQLLKLTNQSKTPLQIQLILNSTGKLLNDSVSNLYFSRINIYNATLSLDNIPPNVNLISPANNMINSSQNQTFTCNATDWQLSNLTFYLWNSSALINQTAISIAGTSNQHSFNVTNLSSGTYKWNCLSSDAHGNSAFSLSNFTLTIKNISVNLLFPADSNFTNLNITNFTCQSISESRYSLKNLTFYLWNSSALIFNETRNITNFDNSSVFNFNFSYESFYLWNCLAFNNNSASSIADSNFTIVYDITSPSITLFEPADATSSTTNSYNFTFNVSDNYNLSICKLIFNDLITNSVSLFVNSSSSGMHNSSLGVGSHTWSINCTDLAGNSANSSSRSLAINSPPPISGSGGGSSSAPITNTYSPTSQEISQGYTKELAKNDKIRFTIFDEKFENHTLVVDYVGKDFVNLTLQSSPVKIVLGISQSIKLNLTSPDYYNLYIKLEDITGDKAKLTIQLIHETIKQTKLTNITTNETKKEKKEIKAEYNPKAEFLRMIKQNYVPMILIIISIIIIVITLTKLKKRIRHRKKH